MKCVAYCRVSTDSDDQINSLENQIKHYTELFKKEGYQGAECGMYYSKDGKRKITKYIPSIFADEGISGTKLKNREAFKYMINCAKRKEFDIIYVKNVPRWARSVEDGAGILKMLKVMGIKVIFEDGKINNFKHEMPINVFLTAAQEESRAKSAAVQFGIRKAQEAGKFTSAVPYGYYSENGYLKPISEQLEVVREVFDLYLKGWGSTKISKHLNKKSTPTQKGCKWSQIQIYNILANNIYRGKQVTHTVINTDVNIDSVVHYDGDKEYKYKSQKAVDESEWIIIEKEDLRAVSDEMFELVQEELQKRKELYGRGNRPSTKNTFSNLLYCQHCGRALRRKRLCTWKRKDGTSDLKFEWVCTNHDMYHDTVCQYRNSWEEKKLIEKVKSEIINIRGRQDILQQRFNEYMELYLSSEEVSERIESIKEELEHTKSMIRKNLELFTKNIIDEEQYKEQNDELQESKKGMERELYKLSRIDEEREIAKRKYQNYVAFLNKIDLENMDNGVLRKVIDKIEAFSYTNEKGKEVKELYFVWNILDKSFDDIFYKKAKESIVNLEG